MVVGQAVQAGSAGSGRCVRAWQAGSGAVQQVAGGRLFAGSAVCRQAEETPKCGRQGKAGTMQHHQVGRWVGNLSWKLGDPVPVLPQAQAGLHATHTRMCMHAWSHGYRWFLACIGYQVQFGL